jgi:hypothetical protein
VCSAARLAWRVKTRFSLVALRRRLSPGLPLSPTSVEACDPAVLSIEALTMAGEVLFFSWATIIHNEVSRPKGQIGAGGRFAGPNTLWFHWHTIWRAVCQIAVI